MSTPDAPATEQAVPPPRTTGSGTARAVKRVHRDDVDLLRLLGSAGVILSHVGAQYIAAVQKDPANGSGAYWAGMSVDSFGAYAVPVFFAIAGWAVLVGAPPKDSARMGRRLKKTLIPMFVWTALYILWARFRDTHEDPVAELAVGSLFGSVRPAYHLWFMYAYLPVIVLLAFVVLLRAGQRPWALGAVLAVVAAGPQLFADIGELGGVELPRFGWGFGVYSLVYAVLGALLIGLTSRGGRRARFVWAGIALAAAGTVLWYQSQVHYAMPNASVVGGVFMAAVILAVSRLRLPERVRPVTKRLAGAGLGAYFCHVLVIDLVARPFVSADASPAAAWAQVLGLTALVICCSFAASLAWQRIGLQKYLG
ncbi:acyltransferase [Streptomyces sp. KLOTTS4A1]|uniref:acyltransferase n=1 Tax=Streptomyces sp. KLOTTS4A1 TaxID=3390996 RepID=UPI0039F5E1E1